MAPIGFFADVGCAVTNDGLSHCSDGNGDGQILYDGNTLVDLHISYRYWFDDRSRIASVH